MELKVNKMWQRCTHRSECWLDYFNQWWKNFTNNYGDIDEFSNTRRNDCHHTCHQILTLESSLHLTVNKIYVYINIFVYISFFKRKLKNSKRIKMFLSKYYVQSTNVIDTSLRYFFLFSFFQILYKTLICKHMNV